MKLLLHCCCAPCSISCVSSLRSEGIEPELFWYNPNIHPLSEYSLRRDCLIQFAEKENLKLAGSCAGNFVARCAASALHDEYGLNTFFETVSPDTDNRCSKCYQLRMEKTASVAAQEGYSAFTTTLLISPYQDHEAIKHSGEEAAKKYGIDFFYRDFRPLFREGQSAARACGYYMQKYWGCTFSAQGTSLQNARGTSLQDASLREKIFDRVSLLTGKAKLEKLAKTKVLVFGAGGVGSWCAEALVRCGIGKLGIIDHDTVCASNINRQSEATTLTLGHPKAETLKKRLLEINPECEITAWNELFTKDTAGTFNIENADYVIDAIDTINHKLDLIEITYNMGVKLYSSMGMALKMDPSQIKTASVWDSQACPLARLVRQGLRKRGFSGDFTVVYSGEQLPRESDPVTEDHKVINGSVVTVTGTAGFMLASLVLRDITES